MSLPTITDPFAVPDGEVAETPRGAVIEIVEQHRGPKKPNIGAASIIIPNHLRINGIAVWATCDTPATICETVLDGYSRSPFAVTVQVMARALCVGGRGEFVPTAEDRDPKTSTAAIVEIPDVDEWAAGDEIERPWVLLNSHRVYTTGPILVGRNATNGEDLNAALVTMTLLCRRLVIDDEPAE